MVIRTKIFVVSLASATERRDRFTARAGEAIAWSFFDAKQAPVAGMDYDEARPVATIGRALQRGEVGCYSSHFALWSQLQADDADQYIVLEDDVIVDWKLLARIAEHDFAAAGHHYVRLFQKRPAPFVLLKSRYIIPDGWLSRLTGRAYGTQGYVITREGAARMMRGCATVVRPIDDQMDRYWEHGVPNLVFFPFPIMEEFVPSSIGYDRYKEGASAKSGALLDQIRKRSTDLSFGASHFLRRRLRHFRKGQ